MCGMGRASPSSAMRPSIRCSASVSLASCVACHASGYLRMRATSAASFTRPATVTPSSSRGTMQGQVQAPAQARLARGSSGCVPASALPLYVCL